MANIIREMAYAAAKFVATDDGYWRGQLDYLEGQLRARLSGERPSPVYAEDVAREISRARRSPPAQEGMVLDAPAREAGGERVGWETEAEWELEQRAFAWANNSSLPSEARALIGDLWKQYVLAASPAEPAAHSLQTLAPASDAVKPGDETTNTKGNAR
jgi:hypothetical protein